MSDAVQSARHPLRQRVAEREAAAPTERRERRAPRVRRWRSPTRFELPLGGLLRMAATGLALGGVFFLGTLHWAHPPRHREALAPPRAAAVGAGADPFVESRYSRLVLERQSGSPAGSR